MQRWALDRPSPLSAINPRLELENELRWIDREIAFAWIAYGNIRDFAAGDLEGCRCVRVAIEPAQRTMTVHEPAEVRRIGAGEIAIRMRDGIRMRRVMGHNGGVALKAVRELVLEPSKVPLVERSEVGGLNPAVAISAQADCPVVVHPVPCSVHVDFDMTVAEFKVSPQRAH